MKNLVHLFHCGLSRVPIIELVQCPQNAVLHLLLVRRRHGRGERPALSTRARADSTAVKEDCRLLHLADCGHGALMAKIAQLTAQLTSESCRTCCDKPALLHILTASALTRLQSDVCTHRALASCPDARRNA